MSEQKQAGNEQAKDPFEMSDDEFQEALAKGQINFPKDDQEGQQKPEANIDGDNGQGDEAQNNRQDVQDKGDKPKPFTLDDQKEKDQQKETGDKQEFIEIVHRGQVHRVTREKAVELAQKGFDYDFKVGPHGRIVQLIQSDPGAAKVLNDYIQGKIKPQAQLQGQQDKKFIPKPLDDFNGDEKAWLAANMKEFAESIKPKNEPVQPQRTINPQQSQQNAVQEIARSLMARDPENYHKVAPRLEEFGQQLSVRDYQRVNSDFASLCKFYDYVKGQVVVNQSVQQSQQHQATPSFRVKSGGGEPPRNQNKETYPWELPKKDFQAIINKIKGF